MTLDEQVRVMEEFTSKMKEICLKKGNDYANDDRLSNFKKVGSMVNQGAQMPILVLMATKVARLSELLTGDKDPNNESVDDSFLDLAIYAALGYMVNKEVVYGQIDGLIETLAKDAGLVRMGLNKALEENEQPADDEVPKFWVEFRVGQDGPVYNLGIEAPLKITSSLAKVLYAKYTPWNRVGPDDRPILAKALMDAYYQMYPEIPSEFRAPLHITYIRHQ